MYPLALSASYGGAVLMEVSNVENVKELVSCAMPSVDGLNVSSEINKISNMLKLKQVDNANVCRDLNYCM